MSRNSRDRRSAIAPWSVVAAAAGAIALVLPAPGFGQGSAGEVLRTVMDRSEARLEGVDSVTVVQELTMPMGMTRRQELRLTTSTRNGRTVLVPARENAGTELVPAASMLATMDSTVAASVLRGRSEVDGHDVYVVAVPDLPAIDFGQDALAGARGRSFEGDSASFYVDAEQYVPRRAEIYGQMTMGDTRRTVQVGVHLSDYRETRGYLHPFRSEIQIDIEGLGEQMQAMMRKMQRGGGDSARQAMMEQAMAAMMGNGITVTAVVTKIHVSRSGSFGGG